MVSTDKSPLVIIGAGGHARVVLDIAQSLNRPVAAFVDEHELLTPLDGVPVLKSIQMLTLGLERYEYIVAIGDNFVRARVTESLITAVPQIRFATLVHPRATIARTSFLDPGTVVMAGAVVNPGSRVGRHCIINTRASLDHDNEIGNFSSLAPGCVTGGNVRVGDFSAISLGASVIHGITIGTHSIVGAGAVVVEDVPDFSTVIGVPAHVSKHRAAGDPYL